MKAPKKTVNYVNNKDLYAALVELKKGNRTLRTENYVGTCIMQICRGLSMKPNFRGYSYIDEMRDDAIENCTYAIAHFNPDKSKNPFGYFTMVAYRAFIRRIRTEKKENYIKHKNFQNRFVLEGETHTAPNEHSNQVIESFEKKLTEQKKKKNKTGGLLSFTADQPTS